MGDLEFTPERRELLARTGALLPVQDNRITSFPLFEVQQLHRIYGMDREYTDNCVWLDHEEWFEAAPDDVEKIEAMVANGEEIKGWVKVGYFDVWEHVQTFLTEIAANEYLDSNRHNLNKPRVYVTSAHRNPEMIAVRALVANFQLFLKDVQQEAQKLRSSLVTWTDVVEKYLRTEAEFAVRAHELHAELPSPDSAFSHLGREREKAVTALVAEMDKL